MTEARYAIHVGWPEYDAADDIHEVFVESVTTLEAVRAWLDAMPEPWSNLIKRGQFVVVRDDMDGHRVAMYGRVRAAAKKGSPKVVVVAADGFHMRGAPEATGADVGLPLIYSKWGGASTIRSTAERFRDFGRNWYEVFTFIPGAAAASDHYQVVLLLLWQVFRANPAPVFGIVADLLQDTWELPTPKQAEALRPVRDMALQWAGGERPDPDAVLRASAPVLDVRPRDSDAEYVVKVVSALGTAMHTTLVGSTFDRATMVALFSATLDLYLARRRSKVTFVTPERSMQALIAGRVTLPQLTLPVLVKTLLK